MNEQFRVPVDEDFAVDEFQLVAAAEHQFEGAAWDAAEEGPSESETLRYSTHIEFNQVLLGSHHFINKLLFSTKFNEVFC